MPPPRPKFPRIAAVMLAALACRAASCATPAPPDTPEEIEIKQNAYATVSAEEEKAFTRKQAPKLGEWLYTYHEKPQSFDEYRIKWHVRPTTERRTIVLQPLGEMNDEQKKLLDEMREYAEIFFQLPARIEKPLELKLDDSSKQLTRKVPLGRRLPGYELQYCAERILDSLLMQRVPKDAVVYLGITMQDLYADDLNYVFGLGDVRARVGVYSFVRYFPEFWNQPRQPGAERTALLRACKVLNHETGHMFGLLHCIFYDCSMNGSMSLQEIDSAPVHFCPICQRKLQWNIGFDTEKQLKELQAFYAKHNLKDEAAFTAARLDLWRKTEALEKKKRILDE
ncbi:MAG TPA: archaemetzincin [Planctomycetota bacterium]|nr:archaemetzincin [Planctomycetota bacterium]